MRIILAIFLGLAIAPIKAQTFDDIVASNRYIDCADVTFNALAIVERLYGRNQIDSIYQFLDYWESKCGFMESAFRIRTILDIRSGKFAPDSITPLWIDLLMAYRVGIEGNQSRHDGYFRYTDKSLMDLKIGFDSLSQRIASETIPEGEDQSLLLNFYSAASPTFQEIKTASEESRLKQFHRKAYIKTFRSPEFHAAFITGVSQYYGNTSTFGARPNLGFVMGGKHLKNNFDVVLDFRTGPSKNQYSFVYADTLLTHRKWSGMYVGFEYTFDLIQGKKIDLGISPGIGYDRITTITAENDYGEDPGFISSFNMNGGLVLKYRHGRNGGYIGVHLRYNRIDYKNPGGTRLDGNYVNLRFTVGSIGSPWRDSRLRRLE